MITSETITKMMIALQVEAADMIENGSVIAVVQDWLFGRVWISFTLSSALVGIWMIADQPTPGELAFATDSAYEAEAHLVSLLVAPEAEEAPDVEEAQPVSVPESAA